MMGGCYGIYRPFNDFLKSIHHSLEFFLNIFLGLGFEMLKVLLSNSSVGCFEFHFLLVFVWF